MVSTDLFKFRRSDERRMAGVESGEKITSRRESKKKAICQLHNGVHIFCCQGIPPTQLVDPQLIMYFFFILRLLSNFFGNLRITLLE